MTVQVNIILYTKKYPSYENTDYRNSLGKKQM